MTLPRRHNHRKRSSLAVAGEMHLARKASSPSPERFIRGCTTPFLRPCGSSLCGSSLCARPPRADGRVPRWSPHSPPTRPLRPRPTWSAREPRADPRYHLASSARIGRSRFATGRNAPVSRARVPRFSASTRCRPRACDGPSTACPACRSRAEAARCVPTPRRSARPV